METHNKNSIMHYDNTLFSRPQLSRFKNSTGGKNLWSLEKSRIILYIIETIIFDPFSNWSGKKYIHDQ